MPPPAEPSSAVLGINPGDLIGGRYRIVRVLGVGGTGAVFEARHEAIHRPVAIKLLLPELASNPAVPTRFLQEARAANEVQHRNIVQVLDFGNDHGRLYMVMELLQGESLAALIKREAPLRPGAIITLLDPVLGALAAAHDRGIVHRDVKPQNIFLVREPDGTTSPKLIDFGIAKRLAAEDVHLTATGTILGTPAYMSPEQAQGLRNITAAADQFAVGAILFHAITGQVPHQADTYPAMLIALVSMDAPDIRLFRPDLDPRLAAVIMRALARDPAARFPTLRDLREALRPFESDASLGPIVPPAAGPLPPVKTRTDGTPGAPSSAAPPAPGQAPLAPTSLSDEPVSAEFVATRPSRSLVPWVAAAALALAAVWAVSARLVLDRIGPRDRVATPPVAAAARPAQGDVVTFRVDVEPPTATITLDGTVVGQGHAEVIRPLDGRRYQLRLSAPGHAGVSDVLVASSDARVSRVLVALGPPPAPPAPSPAAGAHAPFVRPRPIAPAVAPAEPLVRPAPRPWNPRHPRIDRNNPFGP